MYTLLSLKLHTADLEAIDRALASKVQQAPGFFKDTPVVLDLTLIDDPVSPVTLDAIALLDCIRKHQLQPIVANVSNNSSPLALSIALPLLEGGTRRQNTAKRSAADEVKTVQQTKPAVASSQTSTEVEYIVTTPMLINRPVRSGQQFYARDTDLIVMGQVSAGAELVADNNIHVYGALRGKALCGVSGNTETRIFCQSLEAELVSVAGNYRLLEEIPEDLRGKPAQIWLDKNKLNIEPL